MRKILILTTSLAFGGVFAAHAQEATTPANPPAAAPAPAPAEGQAPAGAPAAQAPAIQRVAVVDVSELPAETQKQVDQVVAQTSPENLQQLRSTVESVPQAKQALEEKGVTAEHVIVTSLSPDGTLTLVTKKAS